MAREKLFYHGGPANPNKERPKYMLAICNTQELYDKKTLEGVDADGKKVFGFLNDQMPFGIRYLGTVKSADEARKVVAATSDPDCIALAAWFHTFHPGALSMDSYRGLKVPYIHIVTSLSGVIPANINMDYMNQHQTPHGCLEGGHALVEMGINQNIVFGPWKAKRFISQLEMYGRVAAAVNSLRKAKILRIGGKMSGVTGTDCSPVELQRLCGPSVDEIENYDLQKVMDKISAEEIALEAERWGDKYDVAKELRLDGSKRDALRYSARQTLAIKCMLREGNYSGWTFYFGNLGELEQLPGMAAQETMQDGYGFGAEGDIMAATMVTAQLIMGQGLKGASSFSEPYVYDFSRDAILYAHMLESNPALADGKPRLEIHPLSIGGKEDPVRAVFDFAKGDCIITSLFKTPSLGYQLMTTEGEIMDTSHILNLPNLPTARGLVRPKPDLETAVKCGVYIGEPHHPALSTALDAEYMQALADIWGIPHHVVDDNTDFGSFRRQVDMLSGRYNH